MPIYEFYCTDCHTIYNFFSRRINTEKIPACPGCDRDRLDKQVSIFSLPKNRGDQGEDPLAGIDESKLEDAMLSMAGEIENVNEDDPKAMAGVMRKLLSKSGLKASDSVERAISRMEAGEDPDQVESDLESLDDSDLFTITGAVSLQQFKRRFLPPKIDDKLYDL